MRASQYELASAGTSTADRELSSRPNSIAKSSSRKPAKLELAYASAKCILTTPKPWRAVHALAAPADGL